MKPSFLPWPNWQGIINDLNFLPSRKSSAWLKKGCRWLLSIQRLPWECETSSPLQLAKLL